MFICHHDSSLYEARILGSIINHDKHVYLYGIPTTRGLSLASLTDPQGVHSTWVGQSGVKNRGATEGRGLLWEGLAI